MNDELKAQIVEFETTLKLRGLMPATTLAELERVFSVMKTNKPNDRSEADRCWAIAITDMQKLVAFFKVYVASES